MKIKVVGAVISRSRFIYVSTRLSWQLLGARMFEQVSPVGPRAGASSLKIPSIHRGLSSSDLQAPFQSETAAG